MKDAAASIKLLKRCQEVLKNCDTNLCLTRNFTGESFKTRNENQIRIMHWNILANALSGLNDKEDSGKTFASPRECLPWDFRRWRVLEEIAIYTPDIITLVELDEGEDLMKDLSPLGYEMLFIPKANEPGRDGTGIFWRSSRFDVIDREAAVMNVEKPGHPGKKLGQVFHTVAFKPKDGGEPFAVCGLHLKSTKTQAGEEIRVAQMKEVMQRLNGRFIGMYPVIICGDFNGSLVPIKGKEGGEVKPMAVNVATSAGFWSCYAQVDGHDPSYTSWKTRHPKTFKYTIDYVLVSQEITPRAVLGVVPDDQVPEYHFPNFRSPSDHLSLVCDVTISKLSAPRFKKRYVFAVAVGIVAAVGVLAWRMSRKR